MGLVELYRTFHLTAVGYTFFSSIHRFFSRIYDVLGQETSLKNFKKTEIKLCIFSDHIEMKLEINRGKIGKFTHVKIKQHTLNNNWFKEEIKKN